MIRSILDFALHHRAATVGLALAVAALGIFSAQRLPIDAVPDITNNQVQINTLVPALSPLDIEKQVTYPIETALQGIPGLETTRSLSRNGFSQVTAIFEDDVDIYFARNQVSERLADARESLPAGADPRMGAVSTGLGEIYMWSVEFAHPNGAGAEIVEGRSGWQPDGSYLTPEGQSLRTAIERSSYLRTVQDWLVTPQVRGVEGVAGVDAIGGHVKQFHVMPDPIQLRSYGITFGELSEALERNNVSTGLGFVERAGEAYVVRASGRLATVEEIEQVVVANREGVPIRIRDLGRVAIGAEPRTGSASKNGEEVVVGTALMLIGANSRTVSAAVDAKLEEIRRSLPPDVIASTLLNRTKLVDATVATVEKNLLHGAGLVVLVLFLLLGHIRAALITALAIPFSMLATVTLMVEAEVSGNLMSLGAIDFGLIVDGAVIVVENALRHLAERQHALGRTLTLGERVSVVRDSTAEMIRPSVFGQSIIIVVYGPVLALTGVEGKMFHPMAMTVIFALLAAFVCSLTVIPVLVALFVTGKVAESENILMRAGKRLYAPIVTFAMRYRVFLMVVGVVTFLGSLRMFSHLGQEFVPTLDEKDIAMHAMRIPSTGLEQSTAMQHHVERTVAAFPEVEYVFSKTGTAELASDPMPPNVSDTFIILKPRDRWPDPTSDKAGLIARLERELLRVPGNNYEFTQPIQMRFNELIAGIRGDVAVKVFGDDFDAMRQMAERIADALREIPGAADVKVEQTEGLPFVDLEIDRAAIGRYGLSVAEVHDVALAAIGGKESGQVFEGDRRFDLVVRLADELREDPDAIESLPVSLPKDDSEPARRDHFASTILEPSHGSGSGFLPLGAVGHVVLGEGQNQVSREQGKRRVVVQANVRGRDLGSFVAEAEREVNAIPLPSGTWLEWGGQYENLVAARERLSIVVPVCFLAILVLLYGAFGSGRYALLIFSGVPLGLSGGAFALWLRDMPFSISAAVGFIALSGVAVLNGLVMISQIHRLRQDGATLEDAVREGCMRRLRPVLMTALVASLGFIPMAFSSGTGAEVQRPLATVVIGGIASSTLLTLLILPALYRTFAVKVRFDSN